MGEEGSFRGGVDGRVGGCDVRSVSEDAFGVAVVLCKER